MHDDVRRRALRVELGLEPQHRGRQRRVLVAQALHQLRRKRRRQWRLVVRLEHGLDRRALRGLVGEQAVGQHVRVLALLASGHDPVRRPVQVFDQHDAQRDCHRPQFADRQRLHPLIGVDEAAQEVGVEAAVGARDEVPGEVEDARQALERPVGEFGQLPVIARRQVEADLADLVFDEVVVVDEPLGRRRDRPSLDDGFADDLVAGEQRRLVRLEPGAERPRALPPLRESLLGRELLSVALQGFGAEQLLANQLFVGPRGGGVRGGGLRSRAWALMPDRAGAIGEGGTRH